MTDFKKDESSHVEMDTTKKGGDITADEIELQQALKNYVPDTEAENKLRRKIDLHLMPILWIMYILNYIDRTNIVCACRWVR